MPGRDNRLNKGKEYTHCVLKEVYMALKLESPKYERFRPNFGCRQETDYGTFHMPCK